MSNLRSSGANDPDFQLENDGLISLRRPVSDSARGWIEKNIGRDNGYQPYWRTVVIEPATSRTFLRAFVLRGWC
jgi:hypothetical protein